MSAPSVRVISIGTLEKHPMWEGDPGGRTGHATTTLIEVPGRSGETEAAIVVDPGLPDVALRARFGERSGLPIERVTHVFLTSFHPDCRRGVGLFEHAEVLISAAEREAVGVTMLDQLRRVVEGGDGESPAASALRADIELLRSCKPAPDTLAPGVDLFPMPGVTVGSCGLLVSHPRYTTLIAGDAVPSREHLERGQVLRRAVDVEQARESLREAVEVADYVVPGRDELVINPLSSGPMPNFGGFATANDDHEG
jgi:glyoxylase-like metal-dependent hydrolase (beta-lactamase superfamily II)